MYEVITQREYLETGFRHIHVVMHKPSGKWHSKYNALQTARNVCRDLNRMIKLELRQC